jgi:hypothetical protein
VNDARRIKKDSKTWVGLRYNVVTVGRRVTNKPIQCPVCDKRYSGIYGIKRHASTMLKNEQEEHAQWLTEANIPVKKNDTVCVIPKKSKATEDSTHDLCKKTRAKRKSIEQSPSMKNGRKKKKRR